MNNLDRSLLENLSSLLRVFFDTDLSSKVYSTEDKTTNQSLDDRNELNLVTKARMSIPMGDIPDEFREINKHLLQICQELDPSIPDSKAKVCRINYYTKKGKIGWHQDRDGLSVEQQKVERGPIVSISLGSSGVFYYKNKMEDKGGKIVLESGDVLIFGGDSRMVWHAVPKINGPPTIPKGLRVGEFSGRFNIGFY